MFKVAEWIAKFASSPGYNDAKEITIRTPLTPPVWRVFGVHKLTDNEWNGPPTVFFDVRTLQDNRHGAQPINFGWEGMKPNERPTPAYANKPNNETPTMPIIGRMWIEIYKGDRLDGFGSVPGNSSYLVIFKELDKTPPQPPPPNPQPPDPNPEPPPPKHPPPAWPTPQQAQIRMTITSNKKWLMALPVDDQGGISFLLMRVRVDRNWIKSMEADEKGNITFVAPVTRSMLGD